MSLSSRACRMLCRLYGQLLRAEQVRPGLAADRATDAPCTTEPLESRLLLSTYTVDSLDDLTDPDDGLTTLREAIVAANANPGMDRIELGGKLARRKTNVVELLEGPLTVTDDLEIKITTGRSLTLAPAAGESAMSLTGSDDAPVNVILDGVDFDGDGQSDTLLTARKARLNLIHADLADSTEVGLTAIDSIVSIFNCTASGNAVEGFRIINSDVSMRGSLAEDNGDGLNAYGSTLEIADSAFNDNTKRGLWSGNSTVAVYDSVFEGNQSSGLEASGSTLEVARSRFSDNSAEFGGGILASTSTVTLNSSVLRDNHAVGVNLNIPGGGGLYAYDSLVTITGGQIDANGILAGDATHHLGQGAGLALVNSTSVLDGVAITDNGQFSKHSATILGGGIYATGGSLQMSGSTVEGNRAESFAGVAVGDMTFTCAGCEIIGNRVIAEGNTRAGGVGAINATVTIADSRIADNLIQCRGDAQEGEFIFTVGGLDYTLAGGVAAVGAGVYLDGGVASIAGSVIDGNTIKNTNRSAAAMGAGLYALCDELTVSGSELTGNLIKSDLAIGGGLYAELDQGQIDATRIADNTVVGHLAHAAGAWLNNASDSQQVVLSNAILSGNLVKSKDIAVVASALDATGVAIVNSTLADNTAKARVAATAILNGTTVLSNSIVWNNQVRGTVGMNLAAGANLTPLAPVVYSLVGPSVDEGEQSLNLVDGDSGNLIGDYDPLFVDARHDDYALQFNSPAKDVGEGSFAVGLDGAALAGDFAGDNRFVGVVDLGALEHQSGPGGVSSDGSGINGGRVIDIASGSPAVFHDFFGNRVKVVLSGPGTGQVFLPADDYCCIDLIAVTGSTAKTSLTVKVAGGVTEIDTINIDGPAKKIVAPDALLTGDITVGGSLAVLKLGDTAEAEQQIVLNGNADSPAMTIVLGHALNLSIDAAGQAVKSIKVIDWLDTAGSLAADTLRAAWIGKLTATGGYDDPAADFMANLLLDGQPAAKHRMLKSFKVADAQDVQITATNDQDAAIGLIDATSWRGGGIAGEAIERLVVDGIVMDMTLDLRRADFFSPALGRARIGGNLIGGAWTLAGDLERLEVGGILGSLRLLTGGSMERIEAASVWQSTLLAGLPTSFAGDQPVSVAEFTGLRGPAATVHKLRVTGRSEMPNTSELRIVAGRVGSLELLNLQDASLELLVPHSTTNVQSIEHADDLNATRNFTWTPGESFPDWLGNPITLISSLIPS